MIRWPSGSTVLPFLAVIVVALAGCGGDDPTQPALPIIEQFDVTPAHLPGPGEVTVSWTTSHATSVELRQDDDPVDLGGRDPAQGSIVLTVSESSSFTLTARNAARSATASRDVQVDPLGAPSIAELDAPAYAEADAEGEARATISWAGVERAETLRLEAPGRDPIALDAGAAEGSVEVRFSEDTTFTLVAENAGGEARKSVTIQVVYVPEIVSFTAERLRIGLGETADLHWLTSNATHVELWQGDTLYREEGPPEGSESIALLISTTLELRAFNEVGTSTSATLEIEIGAPIFDEILVSAEALWLGESLSLSWLTQGGSSLEVRLASTGEAICQVEGYDAIAESSCQWQPAEIGVYQLELSLENLSGVASEIIELYAADGPLITLFAASPEILTAGDDLEISWAVLPDPAGNEPTISLTDDRGGSHPLPAGSAGTFTTSLTQAAPYELLLRATTTDPRSNPNEATASIVVHPRPMIDFRASPEIFDDSAYEEVTLSWTTQDADTLILYRLEGETQLPILEILGADREEGSHGFVPTEPARYRLVATNTIGGQTMAEVEIDLAPTEVISLTANPTSFAQGQEVHLSWTARMADEIRINFATGRYLLEESEAPYLDLPALGVETPVALSSDCGILDTHGCAEIQFPAGFTFPFGALPYNRVWVHTTGYLSFGPISGQASVQINEPFPTTTAQSSTVSLAPFWDILAWDVARYPFGNIYAALLEENGERIFVIQWKDIGYTSYRTASFNFEVVLREDGSFDYRYGTQSANGTNLSPLLVAGGGATIGFQLPDQSDHGQILFNGAGAINGARDHRTFSYRPLPSLPPIGELVFRPLGPQTTFPVTITAIRGDVSHSLSETLTVARKPILELAPEVIEPVAMGEDFVIGWRSSNAESVVVLDAGGEIRCTAPTKEQVDEGLCAISEPAGGVYEYTVRATGAFGSQSERTITATVFGAFGVASFTSSATAIERGDGVELRWLTFATEAVKLLANGVEIYSDESGALTGSFFAEGLNVETEFTLIATNDVGATDEAHLTVGIWPVTFDLQASATTVRPGEEITVSFDARALDGGAPQRVYGLLPLVEVPAGTDRYQDISDVQGATILPPTAVNRIQLPFPFPYMGETHESVAVATAGYISFTPGTVNVYSSNMGFPATATIANNVHLAPFWDNLHHRNVGDIYTAQLDPDTFVIQWTNYSVALGSTVAAPHDLNFQIVLRRNGSFDFRYGTMAPHPTHVASTSQCIPTTCVNEVNASAATIGYQTVGATAGHTLHFGGTNPGPINAPFPGGLSNRTFRYPVFEGAGNLSFRPSWSEPISFCVDLGEETFCKELDIQVPIHFSSLSLSKEEIDPGESVTLSWQTVGGQRLRILDGDQELFSTSDLAEVDAGSFVLTPARNTVYDVELSGGGRRLGQQRVVEVNRFSLTASAGASSGPGSPITLSWNLVGGAGLDLHVLAPMVEISNEDYLSFDLSTDPAAMVLLGANENNKNVRLDFEDGFTFPYFGTTYDYIQVNTDGYLSWETATSNGSNNPFPFPLGTGATIAMAPFWDDLHTRVNGRVLAKRLDADRYVIQWSRVSMGAGTSDANAADLNFLVVLHRDGSFEYRYGLMTPPPQPVTNTTQCNPLTCEREAQGASATIGYQVPGGLAGYTVHHGGTNSSTGPNPIVPGRLNFRAWRFTPQTAAAGSVVLNPGETTRYQLCAIDAVSGEVGCAPSVLVEVPWGIDLFEVSPGARAPGQAVTLSWSVQGLDTLRILADGAQILEQSGSEIQNLGTFNHTPSGTTVYTLEATSMARTLVEERVAHVRTFDLTVTGPTGVFKPGDEVTIQWELTKHVPDDVVMITPMTELEIGPNGEDGFVDISQLEGAEEIVLGGSQPANGFADVAIPFPFPYLGTVQTSLQVFADGYISFASNGGASYGVNGILPDGRTNQARIHIAPFWDDLILRGGDSLWRHSPDADTLIIQWKNFSRNQGSTESIRYDLNFQVVLRSDGSFDYRYGTMAPPPPPFSNPDCKPDDCLAEANGSSATIGYQTTDALYGSVLHVGALFDASGSFESKESAASGGGGYLAYPGGLSNRSFRYAPTPTGSARVVVGRTSDLEVCAIIGTFSECKSVRLTAMANSGELAITEVMIDASNGQPGQWLEIRNLTNRPFDLEGFELRSNQGSHTIRGSLPVAPSAFVTLASSSQVPFTPDYVYDGEVPLDRLIDRLELRAGEAIINSVSWGVGWEIPRDQVLSLDPSFHIAGNQETPDFSSWCPSGPHGSPGSLGDGCLNPWYVIDPASNHPFIDIGGTGARFHELEGNGLLARVPSPGFPIRIFGEESSRVWASSYGWLSFYDQRPLPVTTTSSPAAPTLPRTEGTANNLRGPLFGGFWDRLFCHEHCRVYREVREVEGEKVLIIQWEDFFITTSTTGADGREGSVTFQLQVWEEGDFALVFGSVTHPYPPGDPLWASYEGATAVSFLEGSHPSTAAVGLNRHPIGLHQRAIYFRAR